MNDTTRLVIHYLEQIAQRAKPAADPKPRRTRRKGTWLPAETEGGA